MIFRGMDRERVLGLARVTESDHIPDWKIGFKLLHKFSKQGATEKELDQLQKDASLVYEFLLGEACELGIEGQGHLAWSTLQVTNALNETNDFVTKFAKKFISKYKEQEWVIEHFDMLKAMVVDIQESRLLKFIKSGSAQRVYDDLDRAFYKTLAELRRHQQWRRDMQAIDVTPTDDD